MKLRIAVSALCSLGVMVGCDASEAPSVVDAGMSAGSSAINAASNSLGVASGATPSALSTSDAATSSSATSFTPDATALPEAATPSTDAGHADFDAQALDAQTSSCGLPSDDAACDATVATFVDVGCAPAPDCGVEKVQLSEQCEACLASECQAFTQPCFDGVGIPGYVQADGIEYSATEVAAQCNAVFQCLHTPVGGRLPIDHFAPDGSPPYVGLDSTLLEVGEGGESTPITDPAKVNGPCKTEYNAAVGGLTAPLDVMLKMFDVNYALGWAGQLAYCETTLCAAQCNVRQFGQTP
jgi:hypothetical protein